jgi:hypothetical protein
MDQDNEQKDTDLQEPAPAGTPMPLQPTDTPRVSEKAVMEAQKEPDPPVNTGDLQDRDEHGRFKPGTSGNPYGRPHGSKNFMTIIRNGLLQVTENDPDKIPSEIKLAAKIINMALAGDRKMIELIWNYYDGKPPQNIDVTSGGHRVAGLVAPMTPEKLKAWLDIFGDEPPKLETPKQDDKTPEPTINTEPEKSDEARVEAPIGEQPGVTNPSNS